MGGSQIAGPHVGSRSMSTTNHMSVDSTNSIGPVPTDRNVGVDWNGVGWLNKVLDQGLLRGGEGM